LLVGAAGSDKTGYLGRVYAFSGTSHKQLFYFDGVQPFDQVGTAVDSIPDVNGDGTPDVLVGAHGTDLPSASNGFDSDVGVVHVLSGCDGSVLTRLHGLHEDQLFGISVGNLGDINGDGTEDFAVGTGPDVEGGCVLYSGRNLTRLYQFDRSCTPYSVNFGWVLHPAGDVTGDSLADWILTDSYSLAHGPLAGQTFAFAGNDLFLWPQSCKVKVGFPLTLHVAGGAASSPAAMFAVQFDGVPMSPPALLSIGALDSLSTWQETWTVPSILAGHSVGFIGFGIGVRGGIADTTIETVAFE